MLYMDYTWDLSPSGLLFDQELNVDQLDWKSGDMFRLVTVNGRTQLVKVDPIETFIRGYAVNEESDQKTI